MRTPLLEVSGVSVRFDGLTANDEVDLTVGDGEVAALIGPNGAGKTTLFNVITGSQRPTSGSVCFGDQDVSGCSRVARSRLGMARTYQNLSLVPTLSALDNVTIGLGKFRTAGLVASMLCLPRARRQDAEIRRLARRALDFVGLDSDLPAADLPYGDRRRLEVARALAQAPRLLLLDEPSAGMDPAETADLGRTLRRACVELGVAILVVEHDMTFVRALAHNTTVLEFGRVIASGPTDAVLATPEVAAAYLGTRASM